MKKIVYIHILIFFFLVTGFCPVSGQNTHFRVIGGIPHLPVLDLTKIASPEKGMLVFSSGDSKPMIFTGSGWESLCTNNVIETDYDYFRVKKRIPFLPAFSRVPGDGTVQEETIIPGTVYYSTENKSIMVYEGINEGIRKWHKIAEMQNGKFTVNTDFIAGVRVKTFTLPILDNNPSPTGLVEGALYINKPTSTIRYYYGNEWHDLHCQPVVKTSSVTEVYGNTAWCGGEVISTSGSEITYTGVCWSLNPNPDISLLTQTKVAAITGSTVFSDQLKELLPNKTYHVRAYVMYRGASTNDEVVYGEDISFLTPKAPPIIYIDLVKVGEQDAQTEAIAYGRVENEDGGATIIERGFIWSPGVDPLTAQNKFNSKDGNGWGELWSVARNLFGNIEYHFRAYATYKGISDTEETIYSDEITYKTPEPVAPVLSNDITVTITSAGTPTAAQCAALILSNGGSPITEYGIRIVTTRYEDLDDVAIYESIQSLEEIKNKTFITDFSCPELATTYFIKAYARNNKGVGLSKETSIHTDAFASLNTITPSAIADSIALSGGDITDIGYSNITSKGVCWSTSENPTTGLTTKSEATSDVNPFPSTLKGLTPNTTYYVRSYAVNGTGVAYGEPKVFIMPDSAQVETGVVSFPAYAAAVCGGNVTSDGGASITERGICWGLAENPTISKKISDSKTELGLYTDTLTNLVPNKTYHYRAYAINSLGVSYGKDLTFTIIPVPPTLVTNTATDITSMSATSGGFISDNGGYPIIQRGIIWSDNDPLNNPNAKTVVNPETSLGDFSCKMEGLYGSTTYHVRAYAENIYGRVYANDITFITALPTLAAVSDLSFDIDSVTNTTAVGKFSIENNGGSQILVHGIRYNVVGTTDYFSKEVNSSDIGNFALKLTELQPNTQYSAQAYVRNGEGTVMSSGTTIFTTTSVPLLTTISPHSITEYTAKSGGDISSTGDATILEYGMIWSTDKNSILKLNTKQSESVIVQTGIFSSDIANLTPGIKYYIRAYATSLFGDGYGNIDSLVTLSLPNVATTHPYEVENVSAYCGGTTHFAAGVILRERGVCWGTYSNPSLSAGDSVVLSTNSANPYSVQIKNLMGKTKYYVRAYVITDGDRIFYGKQDSLVTKDPGLAKVSTTIDDISNKTVMGYGNVISNGGAVVRESGFCWSAYNVPTIDSTHVVCSNNIGRFSNLLTALTPSTKYYLCAYVRNDEGISYGDTIIFSTIDTATVVTAKITSITSTDAKGGGKITSNGGGIVTSNGICWALTENPTTNNSVTNSLGAVEFVHDMTGLLGSTTYHVRAYAINRAGTSYGADSSFLTMPPTISTLTTKDGNSGADGTTAICGGLIKSNGGSLIHTVGLVWSETSGFLPDTVVTNKTAQSGTGDFTATLEHLKPGTTYYARAYAINDVDVAYASNEIQFRTFGLPVVETATATTGANFTANSGGIISSNGGSDITESGICWSTNNSPAIEGDHSFGNISSGTFNNVATGLLGNTTYYIRAYAKNSVGVGYGQPEEFITGSPVLAEILTIVPVATTAVTAVSGGNIKNNGGSLVRSYGICWSTDDNFNPDNIVNDVVLHDNMTAHNGLYSGIFPDSLKELTRNTVYYVRAYVKTDFKTSYGAQMSFKTPTLATISTSDVLVNGPTKATCGGFNILNGRANISVKGVVWSTTEFFNPDTVTINRTYDGNGTTSFPSQLTGLRANTTYYVQAYVTNVAGTGYGNLIKFITDKATPATLITKDMSLITSTSALAGGYVTDNGGEPILSRGVVWSTTSGFNPATVVDKTVDGPMGLGSFSATMPNLIPGTTYYLKAYATNDVNTAYANNEVRFTTLGVPKLKTIEVTVSTTGTSAIAAATMISNGGAYIHSNSVGVCWSISSDPTNQLSTKIGIFKSSNSTLYFQLTGLSPATTYHLRPYATNDIGTGYGEDITFTTPIIPPTVTTHDAVRTSTRSVETGGDISDNGGADITAKGIVWSTVSGFNPDTVVVNRTPNSIGGDSFKSSISNMKFAITYYIRAYAVNKVDTAYGNLVTISLLPTSPVLVTTDITEKTGTSAMSGGVITSDGGDAILEKGICWSLKTNPVIESNSHTHDGEGMVSFQTQISELTPNTTYYARAYATNGIGTGYGLEKTFLTEAVPMLTATKDASLIKTTTATSGGNITTDGRHTIITRGICWSTLANPTISLPTKTTENSSSIGEFSADMKDLLPNTNYYVRAYATNEVGTAYGSQIRFSTKDVVAPTVYTIKPFDVDSVRATSGGNITDDGGMPILTRGICWSKVREFVMHKDSVVYNTPNELGEYTNKLVGLTRGTKYYVKAFAKNIKFTAYAESDSLTTDPIYPTVGDVIMSNSTDNSIDGSANVSDDGGAEILARGLCWNTSSLIAPTIENGFTENGAEKGNFTATIENLTDKYTYYVRAYATNKKGIAYSKHVTRFILCPSSFDVTHFARLNGAPNTVDKTITYHSISSNLSGKDQCWLTQNLGADNVADPITDATDATDTSDAHAGWYWQFGRSQGYEWTSGSTGSITPAWPIDVTTNGWAAVNDPCVKLLGSGWRLPSNTEWTNVVSKGGWKNYKDTYGSALKLHAAGYLTSGDLTSESRGNLGRYWSSSYANFSGEGQALGFSISACNTSSDNFGYNINLGFSVRCVRDSFVVAKPTVSDITLGETTITTESASVAVLTTVISDGGESLTENGFCWNTTGLTTDNVTKIQVGNSIGAISTTVTGLSKVSNSYIWAYASNRQGITYSKVCIFKVCPTTFEVVHLANINGAPNTVDKKITYHSVSSDLSGSAQCWLTQNLGADNVADSVADVTDAHAGWYWEFNNPQGYEWTSSSPGSITPKWEAYTYNTNWLKTSDPCVRLLGLGWRLPTYSEWANLDKNGGWNTYKDAYNSALKLHAAGYLNTNGDLVVNSRGSLGRYWATGYNTVYASGLDMEFSSIDSYASVNGTNPKFGLSVRCVLDALVLVKPTITDVTIGESIITPESASVSVSATIVSNGGTPLSESGLCWNTTLDLDNATKIPKDNKIGTISATITGLNESDTYYVWAYASNNKGDTYSKARSFKVCPSTFTVTHTASANGAPVDKSNVVYHSVSSDLSGSAQCWLTQNLGADLQAPSDPASVSEASSGWYWQFNKLKGYKYDDVTARTPATTWISSISQTAGTNWLSDNDPCKVLLGLGWRLPTDTEWKNADINGNWGSYANAYNSVLKLYAAGYLDASGVLFSASRGKLGKYWSSVQNLATTAYALEFASTTSAMASSVNNMVWGLPVRCVRDIPVKGVPSVSDISLGTTTNTQGTVSAAINNDGGLALKESGFYWNTTGNALDMETLKNTTADIIRTGNTVGGISGVLNNLVYGKTYYVWAYAINDLGMASSKVLSFNLACPQTFEVIHKASTNGSPNTVDKKITYHAVNSTTEGSAGCWLAQNLGADDQATSIGNITDNNAGWYWQFNCSKGYIYPAVGWSTADINEDKSWERAKDPCSLLLDPSWRIPTYDEWKSANGGDVGTTWETPADAFNALAIHYAGNLNYTTGGLENRLGYGLFWSSTSSTDFTKGRAMLIGNNASITYSYLKKYGFSLRCIKTLGPPVVNDVTIGETTITSESASVAVSATIVSDGGLDLTGSGLCWNTTLDLDNATKIPKDNKIGTISATITGLNESDTYYVWAYASNDKGNTYSKARSFKVCPSTFTVTHTASANGAPVDKSNVVYHSVSSDLSGTAQCWLTQNLGADLQAPSDPAGVSEASSGWYWQFNKLKGYNHDGTTRTPATTWISYISQTAGTNWLSDNDPCKVLLGLGWRLPTNTEWLKVDENGNWGTYANAYNSELKLCAAGYLDASGVLFSASRGKLGKYWSSVQNTATTAYALEFASTTSAMASSTNNMVWGLPVRCVRDIPVKGVPSVSDISLGTTTNTQGIVSAAINNDGGLALKESGFYWNTTGNALDMETLKNTTADIIRTGNTVGGISGVLNNLVYGKTYYVWAYAINDLGMASSKVLSFNLACPQTFEVIHKASTNESPNTVDKKITYHTVNSTTEGSAGCWLAQNLGADVQATSIGDITDNNAGWYWQFNRLKGYTYSAITNSVSPSWSNADINEDKNWEREKDPCSLLLNPSWRIPTYNEWKSANGGDDGTIWITPADAFNMLTLHYAGNLSTSGSLSNRPNFGLFWSSTSNSLIEGKTMHISTKDCTTGYVYDKNFAFSLRCIKTIDPPVVNDVTIGETTITSESASVAVSATIVSDGGLDLTGSGLCWNTTLDLDNATKIPKDNKIGTISATITGLNESDTYYVWAYASNNQGDTYSKVRSFKVCPTTFTVTHTASPNGAPVDKSNVVYHSVSSDLSGSAQCWLTQNLGADLQAPSDPASVSEASSGWYWQFNKLKGYKYDDVTARTPATTWITSTDNSSWLPTNDPCKVLLGLGWRLPTDMEWKNADINGNWGSYANAYNSVLKLYAAGYLDASGVLFSASRGKLGKYWSSVQNTATAGKALEFALSTSAMAASGNNKAWGLPVRCVRDIPVKGVPSVSDATIVSSAANSVTLSAVVNTDGGSQVTAKGLYWNTTGILPATMEASNIISDGTGGVGGISGIVNISPFNYFYVWAFATNSLGSTGYSPLPYVNTPIGVETTDGDYTVIKFFNSGTFSIVGSKDIEYMVVAGGGGGGAGALVSGGPGGGGGAGGYLAGTITGTGNLTVVVGNGGNGGISKPTTKDGTNGGNSSLTIGGTTILAYGGGRGANGDGQTPVGGTSTTLPVSNCGSGGGAGYKTFGGAGIEGQGYTGGNNGYTSPYYGSGGGGGASGVGSNGTGSGGGNGGTGVYNDILITGTNVGYAGGGGGGSYHGDIALSRGLPGTALFYGGGAGSTNTNGVSGTANTGGGGGGGDNTFSGGAGGSGVVIIRYLNK